MSPAVFNNSAPPPPKRGGKSKLASKLDWDESTSAPSKSKTVVLKHMFTLADLQADPGEILDLSAEIRQECEKRCGAVSRVIVYDGEEDGIVGVRFKKAEGAEKCVALMEGRWFDKRKVEATLAFGRVKFRKGPDMSHQSQEDDTNSHKQQK